MKNYYSKFLFFSIHVFLFFIFSGCTEKNEKGNILDKTIEYEFERKVVTYDFGNGLTKDVELYIDRQNDTVGNAIVTYQDRVVDSSKSLFYELSLSKKKHSDEYSGMLNYYYNPEQEGELINFTFHVISKTKGKTDFLSFDSEKNGNNKLKLNFQNNSDTIVGHIIARHTKDTIVNGEDKIRFREIFLSVDNYSKTNNPFTKGIR